MAHTTAQGNVMNAADNPALTAHDSVVELLLDAAARWPDTPWCHTTDGTATRGDLLMDARRVARGLVAAGLSPGDHVVFVMPNGLPFLRAWFGAMLIGAIPVAVNPRAAEAEAAAVADEVGARAVIVQGEVPVTFAVPVFRVDELVNDFAPLDPRGIHRPKPDDPVTYIQSSGSTGHPKFVIETHRMYAMAAEGFPWWLELDSTDVMLTCLPLSHLNAQIYSVLGSLVSGAQLVLLARFSASTFWDEVAAHGVTQFNAIGAMVEALMSRPITPAERDNTVRVLYSAPAPPTARHREIEERFGLRLVIGYALSESPYGLIVPLDRPVVPEAMGVARQHPVLGEINQARVVDATGAELPTGETGELVLRNPAITPGYFGRETESAALVTDGWLHTGDLAYRDADGYHYFAGRMKEIIRHKGENLSPTEVENAISSHPAVAVCAVIGVPSPMSEEDVKAFVQTSADASVTAAELDEWSSARLPPYKRPRYIEFVTDFPLTETQKIAKTRLTRERTTTETDLRGR